MLTLINPLLAHCIRRFRLITMVLIVRGQVPNRRTPHFYALRGSLKLIGPSEHRCATQHHIVLLVERHAARIWWAKAHITVG